MYVNLLSTYSDKKSCHTSTTLQTSIARFVSDSWASYCIWGYTVSLCCLSPKCNLSEPMNVRWKTHTILLNRCAKN